MEFFQAQIVPWLETAFEFAAGQMPTVWWQWPLQIVFGVAATYVVISFVEHYLHSRMMHTKRLPKVLYKLSEGPAWLYNEHAVLHHGEFYSQFDYEPRPEGKDRNLTMSLPQTFGLGLLHLPIILGLGAITPVAGVCFILGGLTHNLLWNVVHTQMHIPKDTVWRYWWPYRALAFHHFMHHQQPMTNFNVVFPFADFIYGDIAKVRRRDIREMVRLGYVLPRSERGKKLQPKMTPRPRFAYKPPAAQAPANVGQPQALAA